MKDKIKKHGMMLLKIIFNILLISCMILTFNQFIEFLREPDTLKVIIGTIGVACSLYVIFQYIAKWFK